MNNIIRLKYLLCLIGLIGLIGFFYLYRYRSKHIDRFDVFEQSTQSNPLIYFLSPTQAVEFIGSDPDNYIKRFNELDWKARQIINPNDYTNLFANSVVQPSDKQIQVIKSAIDTALELIDQIDSSDKIWIDLKLFKSLPWKFIITNSKQIDQGLPHTRFDTIVLNQTQIKPSLNFIDTLLHEQLHVYQKVYPEQFDLYLQANGFVKLVKYIDSKILYRSNPDTDDWIYKKKSNIYCSQYIGTNPQTIFEVKFSPSNTSKYEHPREKAVYDLLEKLFKK